MRVCVLSTYHYHIIIHSLLSAVVRHQYSRDRTSTPVGRKSLAGSRSGCALDAESTTIRGSARDRGHDDELAAPASKCDAHRLSRGKKPKNTGRAVRLEMVMDHSLNGLFWFVHNLTEFVYIFNIKLYKIIVQSV